MRLLFPGTITFMCVWVGAAMAAQIPAMSGSYATTYNEICQANNPSLNNPGAGETYTEILIADFDTGTSTVTLTGQSIIGPIVGSYVPLAQKNISATVNYTNTASTLTIKGTSYSVVYGPVHHGMAQSAVFGGITNTGCAASATMIKQ
jgi:hypothetical protein